MESELQMAPGLRHFTIAIAAAGDSADHKGAVKGWGREGAVCPFAFS